MNFTLVQLIDRGDLEAVQRLLDQALPPATVLNEALRKVVRAGRHEFIGLLVSRGAQIEARDEQTGWSLLHSAVEHRQLDSVRELVRVGANVDIRDASGATPLHLACDLEADAVEQTGRDPDPSAVELLLELGADPRILDNEGKTARDWAIDAGLEVLGNLLR